jgi:integrase/recombinase XerD
MTNNKIALKEQKKMITLEKLFDNFLLEKTYVQNCAPTTVKYLRSCFRTYRRVFPALPIPNETNLLKLVVTLRQEGMSAGCCNTYFKGLNSFLDWLYVNQHTTERLRLKLLKKEKKVMRSFTDMELKRLLSYKAKSYRQHRLHTLICLLIDTGIRVDEALTLKRSKIDFPNLLVTVFGKGSKERVVPISFEMRRLLLKLLQVHTNDLAFCTLDGKKLNYQNTHRDFTDLCRSLEIPPEGFHCLRRTFARNYLKTGGNLIYLQVALGHERVETTRSYVEVETEDLQIMQVKTSILSRLK